MSIEDEIKRLEASLARMDSVEAEDVDSEFYRSVLARLVELRKERDGATLPTREGTYE